MLSCRADKYTRNMPQWDAAQYLKFGTERTQPAVDLIQRIELSSPRRIIDLGCGPGNSTEPLRRRWPDADISGLDCSPEMIAAAREAYPQGKWEVGDAASWQTGLPFDLVFANAMLHWLPDHARVCQGWMQQVAPGGALAVQQPAHYDDSARGNIIEVSKDPAWNDRMNAARTAIRCELPSFYYDVLQPLTSRLSIWETTYHHILPGPEGVLEWFRGTGLRPFLEALSSDEERARFEAMLLKRFTVRYPRRAGGQVLFPFRRLFFVAYR
jgi:trans-aconitate 2-methyltransferase